MMQTGESEDGMMQKGEGEDGMVPREKVRTEWCRRR